MKKAYLIFIGVAIAMSSFMYFYPADIFEAEVSLAGESSNGNLIKEITLKQIISQSTFSNQTETTQNQTISPTLKGWFMLFICTLGIPAIIAWRSTLTKYNRKSGEEQKSIYDKLK